MHTPMYKNMYTRENIEEFVSIHTDIASGLVKRPFEYGVKQANEL